MALVYLLRSGLARCCWRFRPRGGDVGLVGLSSPVEHQIMTKRPSSASDEGSKLSYFLTARYKFSICVGICHDFRNI